MKNLNLKSIGDIFNSKIFLISILIFVGYSCEKEKNIITEFDFQLIELTYYPEKQITMIFDILPKGNIENYTLEWFNPDSLEERGPYTITFSNDIILDYEVSENDNTIQRFQHKIMTDTIDSLKYDYRKNYIGTYNCNVKYTYEDSTSYYKDTLTVEKSNTFKMLNIEGNAMTYLNSNGYYNYQTGNFYGYHSSVLFSNDSIHYITHGSLGNYYTISYEGVKIKQ